MGCRIFFTNPIPDGAGGPEGENETSGIPPSLLVILCKEIQDLMSGTRSSTLFLREFSLFMKFAGSVWVFLCLGCFLHSGLFAQYNTQYTTSYSTPYSIKNKKPDPGFANRWNLGFTLGPDFLYGDLVSADARVVKNLSMGGSLVIGWQVSNVIGARLEFMGAWLNGSVDSLINGEVISNPLTGILLEANLQAVINFTNLISPYRKSRWFFLYGTMGLGYAGWYTEFSNQVYNAGTINSTNPLQNFHAGVVIPVGLGALFRLGDRVNASIEYSFHFVNSDYLDQTVWYSNNDRFDYLAFGISLNLGKSRKKPAPAYDTPPAVYPSAPPSRPVPRILDPTPPMARETIMDPPTTYPAVPPPKTVSPEFTYTVQICAFAQHTYTSEWIQKRYRIPMEVRLERSGKADRFLVGQCSDLPCAEQLRDRMVRLGITDAFIVAYQNGIRHHIVKQ